MPLLPMLLTMNGHGIRRIVLASPRSEYDLFLSFCGTEFIVWGPWHSIQRLVPTEGITCGKCRRTVIYRQWLELYSARVKPSALNEPA